MENEWEHDYIPDDIDVPEHVKYSDIPPSKSQWPGIYIRLFSMPGGVTFFFRR